MKQTPPNPVVIVAALQAPCIIPAAQLSVVPVVADKPFLAIVLTKKMKDEAMKLFTMEIFDLLRHLATCAAVAACFIAVAQCSARVSEAKQMAKRPLIIQAEER